MTIYEAAVLNAVNIASAIHRDHKRRRYQATVADIADVLHTDERLLEEYGVCTRIEERAVQNYLVRLSGGYRARRALGPLVERVGTKKGKVLWALTPSGARVLGA